MPDELLAMIVGIVCGVLAGIPTSILILVVMFQYEMRKQTATMSRATYFVIEPNRAELEDGNGP